MTKFASALFISLLLSTSILIAEDAGKVSASSPDLTGRQQELWNSIVAPLFCKGQAAKLAGSGDDYSVLFSLSEQASQRAIVPHYRRRAVELHVALETWRKQFGSQLDVPSTETLQQVAQSMPRIFSTTDALDLHSIYIRRFENETTSSARQRATAAFLELQEGTSFSEVAMKYSDARSSALGGSAGTIHRGTIAPEVEAVVFSLREGETTGPVERDHGFHIYRASRKRPAFSLDQKEDFDRVNTIWRDRQVAQKLTEMVVEWKAHNNVEIRKQPASPQAWVEEPWISYGKNQSEPFGLVFESVSRCDWNTSAAEPWSTFWQGEAQALAPTVMAGLVTLELVKDSEDYKLALQLANQMQPGWHLLQEFNASLSPTSKQLEQFIIKNSATISQPPPRYTFLFWLVAVPRERDEASRSHAARLQTTLNQVFDSVVNEKPAGEAAAESLFKRLASNNKGSTWTLLTDSQGFNPFIDPVLFRTPPGTLSRPFDNENGVGLVYMISKRQEARQVQDNRSSVEYDWRREQLRAFISKHLTSKTDPVPTATGKAN